ncbi:hypothetical protein TSH100_03960 [Azospirillum sp. TSH100]|uniref:hypothetical protein n=1 Tax=Azospirillum sp. TSH100 TaxID=652764 RepID=UPI000D615B82|nr:hypothetical protein [Azospirillum sp. TSH100]PWC89801.1 hypothetical protein TSH100_03960 [Azospirillum sp. TSH100]QCG92340.1 hypothetical protein E6C72_31540 [Azospirillum sp. TSH100]
MPETISAREDAALGFDPFDGDYGDGETRIIDAIVEAPEPVRCHICAGPIKPGTKVRRIVETSADLEDIPEFGSDCVTKADLATYERSRSEYLICEPCCDAARKDNADESGEGDRLDRRYALGERRRRKGKSHERP